MSAASPPGGHVSARPVLCVLHSSLTFTDDGLALSRSAVLTQRPQHKPLALAGAREHEGMCTKASCFTAEPLSLGDLLGILSHTSLPPFRLGLALPQTESEVSPKS